MITISYTVSSELLNEDQAWFTITRGNEELRFDAAMKVWKPDLTLASDFLANFDELAETTLFDFYKFAVGVAANELERDYLKLRDRFGRLVSILMPCIENYITTRGRPYRVTSFRPGERELWILCMVSKILQPITYQTKATRDMASIIEVFGVAALRVHQWVVHIVTERLVSESLEHRLPIGATIHSVYSGALVKYLASYTEIPGGQDLCAYVESAIRQRLSDHTLRSPLS